MTGDRVTIRKRIELDAAQQTVASHSEGPLLLLGGPGTGKTVALEERFVGLACERARGSGDCTADRILFLVPNRTQKMGLQDRLTRRLLFDEDLDALIEVPVYTWHGLAHHLVSRHYDRLAYPEPPVLLTSPEQWGDVRDALGDEKEVDWPHHRHLLKNRGFVDEVVDFCIRAEQRLLDDTQLEALAAVRPAWADIVRFFKAHRVRLRSRSRVDYPTLLGDAADLVANHDDVRAALHQRFRHILVDDGQELALVQQRLLHFLAGFDSGGGPGRSLVLAGDPDSAIETFRGADPDWIEDFAKEFGAHETLMLKTSYRLGADHGDKTIRMISRNGDRTHRPTEFAGDSELEVRRFSSLASEVEAIARELRLAHLQDHVRYEDMAILLTSPRSMLPPLERALTSLEVPFSITAPDRPLGREPIVRAFADLAQYAFAEEPEPEKLVNLLRSPLIDLEDATVRELERIARLSGKTLAETLEDKPAVNGDANATEKIAELLELRDILRTKENAPADEAFWVVWDRSHLCADLQAKARRGLDDPAHRDLDALVAFSRALGRFVERRRGTGTFADYLEAIGRADFGSDPWLPPERAGGGINVVSFHGAKGKEWAIVAVAGVIDGQIPKGRRATGLFDPYFLDEVDPVARFRKNEAEDRRVFYVAVTRASKRCIVTTSPGPSRRGEPSRFIEELNGEIPEIAPVLDLPPLTYAEAAARYRRVLSDTEAPSAERVAALAGIAQICESDPTCSSAQPQEWWWRWDWTPGEVPIRVQQADKDDDLPLDKLRTSYSRISTYDNCGLQYLYSVVLGLDPESSHNMAFGSVIHKVFEELEDGTLPVEPKAAYDRYEVLFDGIRKEFPNKAIARQFHRDGQKMIERYGTYLKPGQAALAERGFKVELDGHRITGRIDRVDVIGTNNVVISDYKTSSSAMYYDEAKRSLQLAIYYLAAKHDPEISALGEPKLMRLLYPKLPISRGKVAERTQNPEQAEEALERLPGLMEGVLAEDFRPNPEADCQWCKFKPICPLWSEGKELPA
ncbi:MAG TPA: ATP-dependent DNA helicase [Actinomycetota bacterium]|nr:ATP-dependent DNA helicase [Actinomycetota bacterium]